ncbi:MAG: hypothetical protein P4L56_04785 [Candidatus Sulfopaludibacter sp.]|nr:hypothetical protein [Candidatus Sulfopaludibacter sp.]
MTRLLLRLLAFPAFCVCASAATVTVSGVMNIFFGTATLYSGGNPVSQTTGVTAETEIGSEIPSDVLGTALTDLGPGIVSQVLADPTVTNDSPFPPFPAFVLAALPGLENANGLGSGVPGLSLPALLNLLETQSTPFAVASDTGPVYFPDPSLIYTYAQDFTFPQYPGTTYEVDVNVNFYQDNLRLDATPEPSSFVLAGSLLLVLLCQGRSQRRKL